jgi:hypothetical protein
MMKYKIVRSFLHREKNSSGFSKTSHRTIKSGLTLEEAKAHCADPKTHKGGYPKGQDKYKGRYQNWFDGFEAM